MRLNTTTFRFLTALLFVSRICYGFAGTPPTKIIKRDSTVVCDSTTKVRIDRNTVFVELAGNAGFYSLNYDRIFPLTPLIAVSARIGYSLSSAEATTPNIQHIGISHLFPVEASFLLGKKNKLEIGLGYTPLFCTLHGNLYDFNNYTGARLGYRYQPAHNKGFFFKVGILYAKNLDKYLGRSFVTGGIALGKTF